MKLAQFGFFPIDCRLDEISDTLLSSKSLVLAAETGAGKTTRVPPYLLNKISGKILVLEPRRLAASLTARRVAESIGEPLGQTVGYHIRQQKCFSRQTRLLFITEGMLLNYMLQDPDLLDIEVVILDEFHERNLFTDLSLSLLRLLQERRANLKVLVMSATLDTNEISKFLHGAPVIAVSGRTFPLDIRYRDYPQLPVLSEKIKCCLDELLCDSENQGDILVFSIGAKEIEQLRSALADWAKIQNLELLALYSSQSEIEQSKIFEDSGVLRRVIFSTNVAETSLTLPNITAVIDLGEAKISGIARWSGMSTLETMRISKASANQRAGRAGRVAAGIVYRLYSRADYALRADYSAPEIERADLSHILLVMLTLGHDLSYFPWLTPPTDTSLNQALELLRLLKAMDRETLTALGKQMALISLQPRLSALIFHAKNMGIASHGIFAAAILSEEDFVRNPHADQTDHCDLLYRLQFFKNSDWAKNNQSQCSAESRKIQRVKQISMLLHQQLGLDDNLKQDPSGEKKLWRAIFSAYPDRLAKRQSSKDKSSRTVYHFYSGRGGGIARNSILFSNPPEYLLALDSVESLRGDAATGIQVRLACGLSAQQILEDPAGILRRQSREEVDSAKKKIRYYHDLFYGSIKISSQQISAGEGGSSNSMSELLKKNWPFPFEDLTFWNDYHRRIALLTYHGIPHDLPNFATDLFDLFLESICADKRNLEEVGRTSLRDYIWAQLSELERYRFSLYMPDTYLLSNGIKLRLCWDEVEIALEAPLQQFYGVDQHPSLFDGRISLLLRFLSPARRIIQTTKNLPNFWKGSYLSVAKEMRAEYPKHFWPETPETAPVAFLKHQVSK